MNLGFFETSRLFDCFFLDQMGNTPDPTILNLKAVASVNRMNQEFDEKSHHFVRIDPESGRYVGSQDAMECRQAPQLILNLCVEVPPPTSNRPWCLQRPSLGFWSFSLH